MTYLTRSVAALTVGAVLALPSYAGADDAASPQAMDREAMEKIIHDYLMENPEVLIRSITEYQRRQRQAESSAAIDRLRDDLERSPTSPTAGNPDGDITLVEFTDYRCPYCKRTFPHVRDLLAKDGNIRYVVKELPVLGPDSVTAARAALAVWLTAPDRYMAYHTALMTMRGTLNEDRVLDAVAKLNIDLDAVKAAMEDPRVSAEINKTMQLARQLRINGTPAFVIGGQLIPGAVDRDTLEHVVSEARGS